MEVSPSNAAGSGGASNLAPPSWKHKVPCPFSVEPYSGDIGAGGEQVFTVRFSPQEVRSDVVFFPSH